MGLLNTYDDYQKRMAMMNGQTPNVGTPPYAPNPQPQQMTGLLGMYDRFQNMMQQPQAMPQPTVQTAPIQTEGVTENLGMTPSQPTPVPNPTMAPQQNNGLGDDSSGFRKLLMRMFAG